jgi:gas vesicle protein
MDKQRKQDMAKSFVKGTLFGAVVAGVAALLLAPKSGKETRDDIKGRVKGTYQDIQHRLEKMSDEMNGRVESLREAAKDLKGEAREESQELIRRAEVLKQDLRVSANNLASSGVQTKDVAVKEVKGLLGEGAAVMSELERVTKHLANSARQKVGGSGSGSGNAGGGERMVDRPDVQPREHRRHEDDES